MREKINKRVVDAALPGDRDRFLWDRDVKGFGIKITPAGAKIYVLQYRCKGLIRRYTIGRHGSPWTAEEARKQAVQLLASVVRGIDPADAKREGRADVTFAQFAERYLVEHADLHKKPRSAALDRWLLRIYILPAIGGRRLTQIGRADIARLHRQLAEKPTGANRALNLISTMLGKAEAWGLRAEGTNPCRKIEKFRENSRRRFLSESEIARLGAALARAEPDSPPVAIAAIRLLILTGARKSEILTLEWRSVRLDQMLLELADSKTGAKPIYLNAPAAQLLASLPRIEGNPYVLPGDRVGAHVVSIEKTWRRVRKEAALDDVRLHDLRHSFAAVGASAGFSLPLIGALLGHSEVATTQRYAHLADDPTKAAAEAIGARIAAALSNGAGMG
jgi:integrase